MLTRRLYLQIYLTVLGTLIIVVVLSGLTWSMFARDRLNRDMFDIVGSLAYLSLPDADAPIEDQRSAVARLGRELDIDITLFDEDQQLIAASGRPSEWPVPEHAREKGRWQRQKVPHEWVLHLPDGRWLTADLHRRGGHRPLWRLLAFLCVVALGVGLGAYPLVRRLTRRLERLQQGVEKIGNGELDTHIEIGGRDEIAELANSFNDAAAKIQTLVAGHRMLLANASHELRTPISRIRMGIEMLKGGDPARRAALEQDIAELDQLIDEILVMSRLEVGGDIDRTTYVDLSELASEEAARYPECDIEGTATPVPGDARLLRRMVRNLVINGVTHGAAPVRIELHDDGLDAVLTVRDAGPGISADDRDKVFQPFFRGRDRQNVNGYGLGLALVRQICAAHGGTVQILDKCEIGSAIRVRIPTKF